MDVKVSKKARQPANNYMKTQVGLCALWVCSSLVMAIIGWVLHSKIKGLFEVEGMQGAEAEIPPEYVNAQSYANQMWWQGLANVAGAVCVGSAMIYLAKHFLETANGGAMKCCGILDFTFGCCDCLSGVSICGGFIFVMILYGAMSDPVKVCAKMHAELATTPAPSVTDLHTKVCEPFITGLKSAIGLFAFFMCFMGTVQLVASGLLCFGGKNALDVAKVFDEEGDYDGLYDNESDGV